ncbi:MAG: hypothetical protein V5A55_03605 [Halovenus sp.]
MVSETELTTELTGLVVESLAVKQDFGKSTIGCRVCGDQLSTGDRVTVALRCYENFSWEIQGVYCENDGVSDVADVMEIRAEQQVIVSAVLETAGYRPPRGGYEPDALTLGAVDIVAVSPTGDGY